MTPLEILETFHFISSNLLKSTFSLHFLHIPLEFQQAMDFPGKVQRFLKNSKRFKI